MLSLMLAAALGVEVESPPLVPVEEPPQALRSFVSFVDRHLLTTESDVFDSMKVRQRDRLVSLGSGELSSLMALVPSARSLAESAERTYRLSRGLQFTSLGLTVASVALSMTAPLFATGPVLGALIIAGLLGMGVALALVLVAIPLAVRALSEANSAVATYNRGLLDFSEGPLRVPISREAEPPGGVPLVKF